MGYIELDLKNDLDFCRSQWQSWENKCKELEAQLAAANARIAELTSPVGDQSAARALEAENAQYTGEGNLRVVPYEKPAAPAPRCKCYNEVAYTNPDDGIVYGPGCVNPDHDGVENECCGYKKSCCCYAPAAPITPLAKAGEPGVAHTPASPVSSTGASPSQGDKVEERDGKAAVRCPNCSSDNVDCYDINTLDSGCWKCLSCHFKWDDPPKAAPNVSALRVAGKNVDDVVSADSTDGKAAEVCECGHPKSIHHDDYDIEPTEMGTECMITGCRCMEFKEFKAKGGEQ